ncbi:MAG: hypothetical protein NDI61_06185 [Bdellovibrionaceae bacterium]|nr:hypothetical protein [Pseudobdellovibrionaceae bacterium]
MKAFFALKVVSLLLALIGVLMLINGVNATHVDRFFRTFGGDPTTIGAGQLPEQVSMILCKTRIHAIIWPDGPKIEEFKQGMTMKWLAHDPQPREIGYLDMEKWLGEHCRFSAREVPADIASSAQFQSEIVVEFIDQTSTRIGLGDHQMIRFDGRVLESPDLIQALGQLRGLAQFPEKR